jgi:hypothetical protein
MLYCLGNNDKEKMSVHVSTAIIFFSDIEAIDEEPVDSKAWWYMSVIPALGG